MHVITSLHEGQRNYNCCSCRKSFLNQLKSIGEFEDIIRHFIMDKEITNAIFVANPSLHQSTWGKTSRHSMKDKEITIDWHSFIQKHM